MSGYKAYKPTGVEWIGEIPEHWRIQRLKSISKIVSGSTPSSSVEKYWDGKVVWVTPGDFSKNIRTIFTSENYITEEGYKSCGTTLVPKGSIILTTRAPIGNVLIADIDLCTNQGCKSIIPFCSVSPFFYYIFSISQIELNVLGQGTTFLELSREKLSTFKIPFPDKSEQIAIANYLDHQTQKINRLISNKKAQAEKLKELRQIEINNAVTKGLNPDAELHESGIDWLGEIPKHWELKRLKNVSEKITDGEHIAPNFTDFGMPFLSAKDIRENEILFEEDKFVSEEDGLSFRQRCNPERGDALVVSRGATVGRVSIVKTDRMFCLLGSVILIKPTSKINSAFLFYALTNPKIQENLYQTSQSSAQQAIYLINISFLKLAIPPIKEQIAIAEHLLQRTNKVDKLLKNIETQIEKLQELRKITIYEAVTGKIKVTNYGEATA